MTDMDEFESAPLDLTVSKVPPPTLTKTEEVEDEDEGMDVVMDDEMDEEVDVENGAPLDLTRATTTVAAVPVSKIPPPALSRSPLARLPLGRSPLARSSPEAQPPPPAAVVAPSVYRAPAVSPQIADHTPHTHFGGPADDPSYRAQRYAAEYNPFLAAATAATSGTPQGHHFPASAAYPPGFSTHGFNPIMMVPKIATSPVYVATSPESNPFFGSYEYVSAYDFCRYPYYGGGGGGVHSERLSPESTTVDADPTACGGDDLRDVDPDEIAAIYRQSDFVAFRQRYMESLGPPKNFEKMRRSVPNKKPPGPDGQQCDQTYVMKRKKNNEAAKRSRDAKRQKYIENQISVMYLTKKVSEMKEIKRRLLMSM